MGSKSLAMRDEVSAPELRRLARRERDRAAAARMLAIAGAWESLSRAEAARLAGMERQALRDAVTSYNAEGLDGLNDRARPGRPSRLDEGQREQLRRLVLAGPDMERGGLSAWTLAHLCREVEARWGVAYHPGHMSRIVRDLGMSRQKARPSHTMADPAAREVFAKGGCRPPSTPRARRIRASARPSGFRTRPASARRDACATAGSPVGSARPASAISATPGLTCLPPCAPPPVKTSPWCCRTSRLPP